MKEYVMKIDKSSKYLMGTLLIIPMILMFIGVYGGLMQTLFRAGMVQSDPFMGPDYYKGLTMHGVLNAIVFTTFFAVAFGNAVLPYALRMAMNMTWAWVSGILMLLGSVMAGIMIYIGEATVLYTFYPPLKAHPLFYIGLTLLVIGSWVAFFNWIPMYLKWRKENPGQRTPLSVVGMFTTFIVWFIATLAVAVEILFMLLPWSLGLVDEINVMLARTLFWFFGHPLVYFWLLPAYVMYYSYMPKLAGGKLYSDMAGRLVFMMFIIFSIPVGTHHQYMDPAIGAQWKLLHGFFTFMVALPSLITAFTLAASLEYAGRKRGGSGLFGWMFKLPYFEKDRWLFSYLNCRPDHLYLRRY
jgi:cytochrome c oxidase subunit I